MNADEWKNLIPLFVTLLLPLATKYGFSTGDLTSALTGLAGIAVGVYLHWNQKKVPDTSTAIETKGVPLPVGSNLPPSAAAAKVVGALLIGFLILHTAPAMAQKAAPAPAKPPICDPLNLLPGCQGIVANATATGDLWQRIISAAGPDLAYAKALADAAGTPGSKLRSTCLAAIIAANEQASGANLKNSDGSLMVMPNPNVITKLEQAAELIDNLQPTAPVISSCAPAANAAAVTVNQFLSTLLSGVALKAVTGGVLP